MAKTPRFWLLKSEPAMFSIDDLKKEKRAIWTEVRNYQARNYMRDQMQVGDQFLFYHSSAEPSGVAGIGEIVKTGISDPTALDKNSEYFDLKATEASNPWTTVEVQFVSKLPRIVTLAEIKANKRLEGIMVAQKGSRLSVQPVSGPHFRQIITMARSK